MRRPGPLLLAVSALLVLVTVIALRARSPVARSAEPPSLDDHWMRISANGRMLYYATFGTVDDGLPVLRAYDFVSGAGHELGAHDGERRSALLSIAFDASGCRAFWLRLRGLPAALGEPEIAEIEAPGGWPADVYTLDACGEQPTPVAVALEVAGLETRLDAIPESPFVAASSSDRISLSSPEAGVRGPYELPSEPERLWRTYAVRLEEPHLLLLRQSVSGDPALDLIAMDLRDGSVDSRHILPLERGPLPEGMRRQVDVLGTESSLRYVAVREGRAHHPRAESPDPCRVTIYDLVDGRAAHPLGEADCAFQSASAVAFGDEALFVTHREPREGPWRISELWTASGEFASQTIDRQDIDYFSLEEPLPGGRFLVKAFSRGQGGGAAIADPAGLDHTPLPPGSTFLGVGDDSVFVQLYDRLLELELDGSERRVVFESG